MGTLGRNELWVEGSVRTDSRARRLPALSWSREEEPMSVLGEDFQWLRPREGNLPFADGKTVLLSR